MKKGWVIDEDGQTYVVLGITAGEEYEAVVTNPGTGWAAITREFRPNSTVYRPQRPVRQYVGTVAEVWE